MTRSILTIFILILTATAATALPLDIGFLMISGGPAPEEAGFSNQHPVLVIPVPNYQPGIVIEFDPAAAAGFQEAFVGSSQIWFVGRTPVPPSDEFILDSLFLSQEPPAPITPEEKEALLDAVEALSIVAETRSPTGDPFALEWPAYGEVFENTFVSFASDPLMMGPLVLSKVATSPSTEVDIIEHSPSLGLPIILTIEVEDEVIVGGRITVTPEPGTIALVGVGLLGLGLIVRRRRRRP
jgi:hypothetical protein